MKFLLIAFALIGIAAAALPDSATQGPNPQDIATPEPEYIDIDLPEPPKPAPVQRSFAAAAPIQRTFSVPRATFTRPVPQPITNQYTASTNVFQQRAYNRPSGYQYGRPAHVVRRVHYHRRF
ncbi:uncharacterized protein LOC133338537 [Musca vetustissima]|uniref:uncharacterized protein LOC133338537 n=1 Tax=Musca vetustissima TaxID=27455 RepID=UPI002AB6F382|nr:uncharacterized protein LOC133338537 [Musca vetustissima]